MSPETLHRLKAHSLDLQMEYLRKKTLFEKLKALSHDDLRKALPVATGDVQLNNLLSEYNLAQQHQIRLRVDYSMDHPAMKSAAAAVDDLQHKVDDRVKALMQQMETQIQATAALKADIDEIIEKSEHARSKPSDFAKP